MLKIVLNFAVEEDHRVQSGSAHERAARAASIAHGPTRSRGVRGDGRPARCNAEPMRLRSTPASAKRSRAMTRAHRNNGYMQVVAREDRRRAMDTGTPRARRRAGPRRPGPHEPAHNSREARRSIRSITARGSPRRSTTPGCPKTAYCTGYARLRAASWRRRAAARRDHGYHRPSHQPDGAQYTKDASRKRQASAAIIKLGARRK